MKRFVLALWAIAALAVLPAVAQAAVVDELVFGEINQLEDDDYEALINAGGNVANPPGGAAGDTTLDVGDFLVGMFRITAFYAPPGNPTFDPADTFGAGNETITGIFVAEVAAKAAGGLGFLYTFTAPTAAEWAALLMPVAPTTDSTAIIFFDDPDNINHEDDDLLSALTTVNGTALWEFGFDGDPDLFWTATTFTDNVNLIGGGVGGIFNAALNVTAYHGGPLLVPFEHFTGVTSQLAFEGSISRPGSSVGSEFDVESDFDAFILPVPEPASMTVWGGLMLAGAVAGYRRRKAAKNA